MITRSKLAALAISAFSVTFYTALNWAADEWPKWAGSSSSTILLCLAIVMIAVSVRLLVSTEARIPVRVVKAFFVSVLLCAIAELYQTVTAFTQPPEFEGPKVGFLVLQIFVTLPVIILSILLSLIGRDTVGVEN